MNKNFVTDVLLIQSFINKCYKIEIYKKKTCIFRNAYRKLVKNKEAYRHNVIKQGPQKKMLNN